MDMFSTYELMNALQLLYPPQSFILDTFFTETIKSNAETVLVDIVKQGRTLAPFVNPMREGKTIAREAQESRVIKPAYVKPKMVTTAADFVQRAAGQSPFDAVPMDQRAAQQLVRDLGDLDTSITRREEWMATQALFTGTVQITGEGISQLVDFQFSASHLITPSILWSTAATAVPLDDIDTWQSDFISKDGGVFADIVIMGPDVWKAFIQTTQVKNEMNILRLFGTTLNPQPLEVGAVLMGTVRNRQVWVYNEWYKDDSGVLQPMVPAKQCLLGSTRARCVRLYGAIKDLDASPNLIPTNRFAKSWRVPDPSAQWLLVQSAPLMAPIEVDAFVIGKDVIA